MMRRHLEYFNLSHRRFFCMLLLIRLLEFFDGHMHLSLNVPAFEDYSIGPLADSR